MTIMKSAQAVFPEKISAHYASKFKPANCPLKKQVKFNAMETALAINVGAKHNNYSIDPVGDRDAEIKSGIIRKYEGRLLVLASSECPIHCRFCFRRNMERKKTNDLPESLALILAKDKTIEEVILSGGDPLMLNDTELKALINAISQKITIRIHSRVPVALPERFTPGLRSLLAQSGQRLVFVAHVNHPNELDNESKKIFSFLKESKITVLSQSVLLRGVNDNAEVLKKLFQKLFSQGVLPYYLHQLDRAKGAAHFEVPLKEAKAIHTELRELLPGYLVPRLVKEIKGGKSKKLL